MYSSLRLGAALLLILSLPTVAAETAPLHAQFLPPDDLSLRQEQPELQQLIQITEFSVVLGSQRQSNQQPIPITSPALVRLKGKPLSKGADVRQVVILFDAEGKSLKKPSYDPQSRILSLNYPMAQYAAVLDLLRNGPVYCQFLSYANGHVWADLHSGAVRLR
ncbi:hypothetical protein [Metapseudomonas resinovorans]|uniref:Uncharacterized protein n=1 Tax=Metapseudomonas resinovorans NBRC 106553 TaxID=1245471 RepID=S6ANJ4_METRE|nr:hypothetical protein [Pseudomonas resinovorans]BAN50540.1 hypothetical protein PCA10_48080 [Pseudomonas resinovorans NBRC 106553]